MELSWQELDTTLLRDVFAAHGVLRATLDAQAPLVVNDVEREGVPIPMLPALRQRGIRAYALLPLVANGDAIGVMGLYADEPDSFDAAELDLLNEIAGDIAFGLDHIRKEEQITFLAYYDSLTGLANRSLFHDRLVAMLRKAEREGQTVALCVADLDHFKNFNDALGRESGDLLLVEFGKRLLGCASAPEQVARLGSDRFVIALPCEPAAEPLHQMIEAHLDLCTARPFRVGRQ